MAQSRAAAKTELGGRWAEQAIRFGPWPCGHAEHVVAYWHIAMQCMVIVQPIGCKRNGVSTHPSAALAEESMRRVGRPPPRCLNRVPVPS